MARNLIGALVISIKLTALSVLYYFAFNYITLILVDYQLKNSIPSIKNKISENHKLYTSLNFDDYEIKLYKIGHKTINDRFYSEQYTLGEIGIAGEKFRAMETVLRFDDENYKLQVRTSQIKMHYFIFISILILISLSVLVYVLYSLTVKLIRLKFLKLSKETLNAIDASST